MTTNILAAANTSAQSDAFTVVIGDAITLTPVPAAGAAVSMAETAWAYLEKQAADSSWHVVGSAFTIPGEPKVLEAVGTYRINRPAQVTAIGVDRD